MYIFEAVDEINCSYMVIILCNKQEFSLICLNVDKNYEHHKISVRISDCLMTFIFDFSIDKMNNYRKCFLYYLLQS